MTVPDHHWDSSLDGASRNLAQARNHHDNIAFGNPGASREQVIAAAKAANADFFIQQLPQGYDTKLENAGESLSVGQAQLLTIARVFLAIPKILILDEATSSIDTRTEVLVQDAFAKLDEGANKVLSSLTVCRPFRMLIWFLSWWMEILSNTAIIRNSWREKANTIKCKKQSAFSPE